MSRFRSLNIGKMAVGNRFKTSLASALNKYVQSTNFLSGAIRNGVAQMSNDKWVDFDKVGIRRSEALNNISVAGSMTRPDNNMPASVIGGRFNPYANVLYASLDAEKANRIYEYRLMASFPEVNDCIEKVSNGFINVDERGDVVKMKYLDEDLAAEFSEDLQNSWRDYIRMFDLRKNGRRMCADYLIDGELYYELLVETSTPEHKKHGIIGVKRIQTELMETVYKDKCNGVIAAFVGRVITQNPADQSQIVDMEYVPFHPNQICYITSNNWDPTGEWIVPYIERARKRYIQLSYLEDAIIIYRLVRAPERLIFTVDTGNMSAPKAQQYLRELQQEYWKTKNFDINRADIMQKFEPQSMLDAFWVAKGSGNDGINISQLAGGANLGQLDDLNYFIKALYRAMHVPTNYLDPQAQTSSDPSSILREELEFAQFIIAIQNAFTEPLKQGWITSLKMQGKWEQYKLEEKYIEVEFNPPHAYYEMRRMQEWQQKFNSFTEATSNDMMSKTLMMKRILKWTNDEIRENLKLRKLEAAHEWELAQIQNLGPMWKQATMQEVMDAGAEVGGGGGMGGPHGGGGGGLHDMPDFDDAGFSDDDMGDMADSADAAGDVLGDATEGDTE